MAFPFPHSSVTLTVYKPSSNGHPVYYTPVTPGQGVILPNGVVVQYLHIPVIGNQVDANPSVPLIVQNLCQETLSKNSATHSSATVEANKESKSNVVNKKSTITQSKHKNKSPDITPKTNLLILGDRIKKFTESGVLSSFHIQFADTSSKATETVPHARICKTIVKAPSIEEKMPRHRKRRKKPVKDKDKMPPSSQPKENVTLPPPTVTLTEDEDNDMEGRTPYVSKFLYEGIDDDDELYIAYLSRPDSSKTAMCILCYEWFDDMPQLKVHLRAVHENNMKLYGCKVCGKKFWARFHRQRHEKLHRFDLKGPIERYFPKNRPFDHIESKHFFKRFRPAPFTKKYREHLELLHNEIKSETFDCIQCGNIFQNEEDLREHYEEHHALQTCVHCLQVIGNAKELRDHEQQVHILQQEKDLR